MNKLTGIAMVGLAVFAFSGMAVSVNAAESTGKTTSQDAARSDSAGGPNSGSDTAGDPGSPGTQSGETPAANAGNRDSSSTQKPGRDTAGDTGSRGTQSGEIPSQGNNEQFTAELKKCDSLSGTQKSQCVDAAKKKHGQM